MPTRTGRRGPTKVTRRQLLAEFGFCCAYCDYPFGTLLDGRGVTHVAWDHLVPYSWLQANPGHNFVPSCRLCNSFKGALLFDSLGQARAHVTERWEHTAQGVLWVPSVSNLIDPERWATEYASYLCGRYSVREDAGGQCRGDALKLVMPVRLGDGVRP